ncbi:helix-turn-helix transcriptional regulator [Allobranchiibius sp. CTAmp26]|uniref:helix-turn-helix transcriptional regulator n=1 Tax=Allobranchiibius sp. CTAmp26 TaxID=2815214 RepID=UPI001AA1A85B|nr:helix-turn-helix transcriptional regulator [Allobranchiibius sp. CTAmp26]MBO1754809.1 helix-turn-helix transcriptional regulator [Allobranchiibius sp. CTAmp26]
MTTPRHRSLADELSVGARGDADLTALAARVCAAVRRHVPFEFGCLATTDPATGLISWTYKTRPLEIGDEEFAAAEYGGPDINQFSEIATRHDQVGVLSIDTAGAPRDCRRFREFLAPRFGFTDELRVTFRAQGLVWGALAIYRGPGEPPFSAAEARVVSAVHVQIADLIRDAAFGSRRPGSDPVSGPSVIIVDRQDRVASITAAATARIEDLGGWDHGSLPATVLAATAAARSTPELAMTRAAGCSGTWLTVRATTFAATSAHEGPAPRDDVVVTIESATPAEICAMTLAARGLSPREQDVAGMVLQGAATQAIAAALHLSPHTVQDHLKSIFAKLGVNSRREMVSRLVLH